MPERTPLYSTFVYMMCLTSMQASISFMHRMACDVVHQICMQELLRVVRMFLVCTAVHGAHILAGTAPFRTSEVTHYYLNQNVSCQIGV
jgi:hypothetical protein